MTVSSEWLHYEASEAALKRAAALQATRDNIGSLRTLLPGVAESLEYTELRQELNMELDARIKTVLERVCEHVIRMDNLAAKNREV